MKDKRSLHLKVQEMCDCFVTADPLKEMAQIKQEPDKEEAAVKWLALLILYGIDSHAKKISVSRSEDGEISVVAKYDKAGLPSPGPEIGAKVLEVVRQIAHFEEDKGKIQFALGIRDSSIELGLKMKKEDDSEKMSIKFPKWEAD